MSEVATPEVPVVAPPTPEPTPAAQPDESLASHEQAFGPNARAEGDDDGSLEDEGDDTPVARGRGSRAKSKQAAARINRLTGEVHQLREQLKARDTPKPAPVEAPAPAVRYVAPPPPVDFNEPEPTLEQFNDKDDPYGAWQRALAAYDRKKERADEQAQHMQAHHQRSQQDVQRYWQGVEAQHIQRLHAAIQSNPAHYQALQSITVQPPPLLDWAIMLDNQSADVALFLATHPAILDEFVLYTEAKPVTEQTVAITRRLLRQRMTAAPSGSVAPSPSFTPAPPPPNPLRTGSMTLPDGPPGDDSSLAAHEKYYGRKRR